MTKHTPYSAEKATTVELLRTYREILAELQAREVARTDNAPTGDYAEYLVKLWSNGELEASTRTSWDVTAGGRKLQVKSRIIGGAGASKRQLSPFRRTTDGDWGFDEAVIVLFEAHYGIERAAVLTWQQIEAFTQFRQHVNGWVPVARDSVMNQSL